LFDGGCTGGVREFPPEPAPYGSDVTEGKVGGDVESAVTEGRVVARLPVDVVTRRRAPERWGRNVPVGAEPEPVALARTGCASATTVAIPAEAATAAAAIARVRTCTRWSARSR
jgi:hypothetical protein